MIASEIGDIKVDNQYNYDRLLVSIEASDRILSLLIAVCDDELQREEIIRRYEQELAPSVKPYRLQLDSEEPSLRMAVAKAVAVDEYLQQGNRAVFTVLGADLLRTWLPNDERTPQDKFLGYLQWTREGMREFPFPIVLWVSSSVVEKIARKAPDFWSWRKGVFRFVSERMTRGSSTIPIQELANIQNFLSDFSNPDREDSNSHFLEIADLEELVGKVVKERGTEDRSLETLYSQLGRIYKNRVQTGKAINLSLEKDLAIDYLQKAIALQTKYKSEFTLIPTLSDLADLYQSQGQYQSVLPLFQQALEKAKEIGDRNWEANSLGNLGKTYFSLGQYEESKHYYHQALEIQREIHDRNGEATSLMSFGNAYLSLGQYQEAMHYYNQALEIQREIRDRNGEASSLNNLGITYESLGQYQQAMRYLHQSLRIQREIGNRRGEANSLGSLGNAYESLGQYQEAMQYLEKALEIQREIRDQNGEAKSLGNLGIAYNALGQYHEAMQCLQRAVRIKREIGDRDGEANSLSNYGNVYLSLEQYQEAMQYYNQALEIQQEIGNRYGEANSLGNLGNAYKSLGQEQEAVHCYQQALEIQREIGDRHGEANCWFNLGNILAKLAPQEDAMRAYQSARLLFQEMNLEEKVRYCDNAIQALTSSMQENSKK